MTRMTVEGALFSPTVSASFLGNEKKGGGKGGEGREGGAREDGVGDEERAGDEELEGGAG